MKLDNLYSYYFNNEESLEKEAAGFNKIPSLVGKVQRTAAQVKRLNLPDSKLKKDFYNLLTTEKMGPTRFGGRETTFNPLTDTKRKILNLALKDNRSNMAEKLLEQRALRKTKKILQALPKTVLPKKLPKRLPV